MRFGGRFPCSNAFCSGRMCCNCFGGTAGRNTADKRCYPISDEKTLRRTEEYSGFSADENGFVSSEEQDRKSLQNVQLQKQALRTAINHVYLDALHREELCRQRLELCNPALPLKKGFAYIKREGISVFSAKQLQAEDKVSIHFSDGTVHATVQ